MNQMRMLLVLIFGMSGFTGAKADIKEDITVVQKKISKLNSDLSCTSDQNCIALPYGHKACGGPRSFLVVSKKNKSFKEISNLTERLETLERKHAESSGMASTCDIEIEPSVQCAQNKCVAKRP